MQPILNNARLGRVKYSFDCSAKLRVKFVVINQPTKTDIALNFQILGFSVVIHHLCVRSLLETPIIENNLSV